MKHYYIALGLVVVSAIVAFIGRSTGRKTSAYSIYIDAVNLSDIGQGAPAFYGGTVATIGGQQLTAPYSQQPCVWFSYTLEQEERHRDAEGVEHTEWRTISQDAGQGIQFELQNQSGNVCVNPLKANVNGAQKYEGMVNPIGMQTQTGGAVGAMAAIGNALGTMAEMSHPTRVTEYYIPVGQPFNVGGVATDQNGQKTFATDDHYPLVLTSKTRAQLVSSGRRNAMIAYVIAVVLLFGAAGAAVALKK